MDSESHHCHDRSGSTSFSFHAGEGARNDTNTSGSNLMPWNQILEYNCLSSNPVFHGPFAWSGSFHGGRETRGNHIPSICDDDLSLTLGFGCASKCLAGGLGLSSIVGVTKDLHDNHGSGGQVDIDLGLGLMICSSSSNLNVTKSFCMRPYMDSQTREGWQDNQLEAAIGESCLQCHSDCSDSGGVSRKSFSNPRSDHTSEVDLQLGLGGSSFSLESDCLSSFPMDTAEPRVDLSTFGHIPVVDEGSSSARLVKSGGHMPSLLQCRPVVVTSTNANICPCGMFVNTREMDGSRHGVTNASTHRHDATINPLEHAGPAVNPATTCASERPTKTCKFKGCGKGARGASGLCIAHGGGRRCQRADCNKGAEGRTMFCKAHGGGRRCQHLGCIKSAEGKTDFCIAHGGGRRCSFDGCSKAARGKSGLCIRHGGGKRCQKEGCTKSAEGFSGLCISHGGGRRCQYPNCRKGAQGSTKFCKAHGGGRRCEFEGCTKGAEGSTPFCKGHGGGKRCTYGGGVCTKSVHGGTAFCVAHGGGKRCSITGCTKSARGKTDFCVRHGGGKRCKFEDCTKSAQGSTDFCKAHGGGKRCLWGQEGCMYDGSILGNAPPEGLKGPCDKFARGKTGLCSAHGALLEQYHHSFGSSFTSSASLGQSSSSPMYAHQCPQPHSDRTEQTVQLDSEQYRTSFDIQSQLASSGEGPVTPHGEGPWMPLNQTYLPGSLHRMMGRTAIDKTQISCPPGLLYGTSNDPEERVHGAGHFMALLAREVSSRHTQGAGF